MGWNPVTDRHDFMDDDIDEFMRGVSAREYCLWCGQHKDEAIHATARRKALDDLAAWDKEIDI